MMTLRQLADEPPTLPTRASWYLADLAESKGRQELSTRQSPQKLKVLREHALIESSVSSNRIEGIEVDQSRVATLMFGKPALRDRDEEEVRGYRDALNLIHQNGPKLAVTEATIKKTPQTFTRRNLGRGPLQGKGRGHHPDLCRWPQPCPLQNSPRETNPQGDGRDDRTLAARDTRKMGVTAGARRRAQPRLPVHSPFRDGNGRVSRLLFLLACYHCGIEAGRYISLERIIEDTNGFSPWSDIAQKRAS